MPVAAFATILTALCLCITGCGREPEPARPQPFHIFFTCDTNARIEPCGCFTGQYGGLTRVSTVLKSAPANSLAVEIGNAIGGLEDYHVIQYRHLLEACGAMGYAAVNLGEREARLSATTIRELASRSPVPLLAANLLDAGTREPLVARSVVVDSGPLKVGLVGVLDPKSLEAPPDASVELSSMEEGLRRALDELGGKADVLVCLAFADESRLEKLAREFYEFDVILGGDVRQPSSSLAKVNQSLILATTNQARALGELHAEFDQATGELKQAKGDVRLMVDTIVQDPAIRRFSDDYRSEIRNTVLAIDRPASQAENRIPGVKAAATYVGSSTCASCHPNAYATWSKSGHAQAFDSLVKKRSEADPGCIQCHVVGFGEPGGYLRNTRADHLTGVQCESCHGPGSEHARLRLAGGQGGEVFMKMRPVGQGQCAQCHHGEFSRPFVWDEFWPRIEHGKK